MVKRNFRANSRVSWWGARRDDNPRVIPPYCPQEDFSFDSGEFLFDSSCPIWSYDGEVEFSFDSEIWKFDNTYKASMDQGEMD